MRTGVATKAILERGCSMVVKALFQEGAFATYRVLADTIFYRRKDIGLCGEGGHVN